ncbi:MAG: hypothetical protein PHE49_06260 [bacterium]|nr:hypothetical protein [bacterium]
MSITIGVFLISVILILYFTFFLVHLGVATISGRQTDFKRSRSCENCCFNKNNNCSCDLWNWFILCKIRQKVGKHSFLCPFCYDNVTTHPETVMDEVSKSYFIKLWQFILAAIPFTWGAFIGFTKLFIKMKIFGG